MQSGIQCANCLGMVQSRLPHTQGVMFTQWGGPEASLWCGSVMANVKQQHRPRPQLLMSADVLQSGRRWTKHLAQREVGETTWTMGQKIYVREEF